jgi:hypothetical protein
MMMKMLSVEVIFNILKILNSNDDDDDVECRTYP